MGLAASQARFLGLTARKSNVEYQGQQINQARTALSNEIMNLYQEYNNLKMPTPPSKTDYTKTIYKLNLPYVSYELTSNFSKITSGEYEGLYNITLKYDEETPIPSTRSLSSVSITSENGAEEGGFKELYIGNVGVNSYYYKENDDKSTILKIPNAEIEKYTGLKALVEDGRLDSASNFYYAFMENNTYYYTSQNELEDVLNEAGNFNGNYGFDYMGKKPVAKTIDAIANLTQEDSGRISAIRIYECEDEPGLVDERGYAISTSSTEDENGYTDAMNQYEYDMNNYEREVEIINKKTAKIQAEDKSLELKLKQLDTEQNALKTETDSISKVIEETIESVYKTYNS